MKYPIIADPKREIIKQLNMVDPDEKDSSGNSLPSRALHIVGPDKMVPITLNRNSKSCVFLFFSINIDLYIMVV